MNTGLKQRDFLEMLMAPKAILRNAKVMLSIAIVKKLEFKIIIQILLTFVLSCSS